MKRGEIYWMDLGPPAGRRPILLLSRNAAIPVLAAVIIAPISRTIRDIASEVRLGPEQGLPEECAASCDNLLTVPKDKFERSPVGFLDPDKIIELDRALRFALEINY
ncbi:MAG: type II toxin-antitoxin system PemK/MazF family toxin [Actinobacteria bacterium]|nr:type II toxin-antitoxin system PemK/MazF family toxin [Actinomycetota bacterium]